MSQTYDLLIIGGGINGAGIARDATGRGLSVLLCEQNDLASSTSSSSTKLIHGGLRYLEHYEFRLVRESLMEREVLLALAPHIIWPLSFVLPHDPSLRPAWMVRLGLLLYDNLCWKRSLPASRRVRLDRDPVGRPLKTTLKQAFSYSDCWVDDARLVVLNALDAAERGATIVTRTRMLGARRVDGLWQAELEDLETGERRLVTARILVNAAGPWVTDVLQARAGVNSAHGLRLVKGSHIIVRRLYEGDHAYILQNDDRRIVFTIPYEQDFTLIGTTDVPFTDDPAKVEISDDETEYLLAAVARWFREPPTRSDIVRSYAGVRPLFDDATDNPSAVTRDYVLDLQGDGDQAPILSVFGGKITTYRRLAEHALEKLLPYLPAGAAKQWTHGPALPGGDLPNGGFQAFLTEIGRRYPFLPPGQAKRLARAYGSRMHDLLKDATSLDDLGQDFGVGLREAEINYLMQREWAVSADDILWRRSKLGMHMTADQRDAVAAYLMKIRTRAKGVVHV